MTHKLSLGLLFSVLIVSSPIAALAVPVGITMSCAIDPTTGNLAVVSFDDGGHIAIFKHAAGKPAMHSLAGFGTMYYCTYDNQGNLFVDGNVYGGVLHFAELAKGKDALVNVSLNQSFKDATGVQRVGKRIAIADAGEGSIYQFTIDGDSGTLAGTTQLHDSLFINQFYIDGDRIVAPSVNGTDENAGAVMLYRFPAGGSPLRTLLFSYPTAVVVSRATGS